MKGNLKLFLFANYLCVVVILSSCKPSTIIYKYDKYDRYGYYIDDGDIWGSQVFVFFKDTRELGIRIDSIKSGELDRALSKVLNQFSKTVPSPLEMFDDQYYEYVFITDSRDTLFTNGYFESWKLCGRLIQIDPNLSTFFQEQFDNPHAASRSLFGERPDQGEQYELDFQFLIRHHGVIEYKDSMEKVFCEISYIGSLAFEDGTEYFLVSQSQVINPLSMRQNHRLWILNQEKSFGFYSFDLKEYMPIGTDGAEKILFPENVEWEMSLELPNCIYGHKDVGCLTRKEIVF